MHQGGHLEECCETHLDPESPTPAESIVNEAPKRWSEADIHFSDEYECKLDWDLRDANTTGKGIYERHHVRGVLGTWTYP